MMTKDRPAVVAISEWLTRSYVVQARLPRRAAALVGLQKLRDSGIFTSSETLGGWRRQARWATRSLDILALAPHPLQLRWSDSVPEQVFAGIHCLAPI